MLCTINRGGKLAQEVIFSTYDSLVATNKSTGGHDYKILEKSLKRLAGTRIKTSLQVGSKKITKGFGIINSWEIIQEGMNSKMKGVKVKILDWIYEGILNSEVLTLSPDYFLMYSLLEKRIYELCRKHCGNQDKWNIGMDKLYSKSGSQSTLKGFKQSVKKVCVNSNIPDYKIFLVGDVFIVYSKAKEKRKIKDIPKHLKAQTIENAKGILDRRYDVYNLQYEYLK